MKKKTKAILVVVCLFALLASATLGVYAVYYGKGTFKDVLVNGKSYFSADVLGSVSSRWDLAGARISSNGVDREIRIFNYNLSGGEYNMFDIDFSVYAWLEGDVAGKTCHLEYGSGQSAVITSATGNTAAFSATLAGGTASTVRFRVVFDGANDETLAAYPTVNVVAIPSSPEYMTERILGAQIVPSAADSFTLECYFDYADADQIGDYAAFPYIISTAGDPPEGERLKVQWDRTQLSMVTPGGKLPAGATLVQTRDADGNVTGEYLTVQLTANYFGKILFMRVQDSALGTWNGSTTWETLETLVTADMEPND